MRFYKVLNLKRVLPNIICLGSFILLVNRPSKSLNERRRARRSMNGVRKIHILYLSPELRFKEMAEFPLSLKFDARCP